MALARSNSVTRRVHAASFEAPSFNDAALSESLFSGKDGGKAKNFKVVVRIRPNIERESEEENLLER
eukprot:m.179323 g.179323  ORF g.179323 m.179323 type:complete len:67 (-) comp25386_c0_seq4:75-275(-)